MRSCENRLFCLGLALIDRIGEVSESPKEESREHFLNVSREIKPNYGGVVPNVLVAFEAIDAGRSKARLFACVGNDKEGTGYQKELSSRLGKLQVSTAKPTGTHFYLKVPSGDYFWRVFPEAAEDFIFDREQKQEIEYKEGAYFLTDINAYRVQGLPFQISQALKVIEIHKGEFMLNLAGITGLTNQEIKALFASMPVSPQIIFGNKFEFNKIRNVSLDNLIISNALLSVKTLGEKGSIVRFSGEEIFIPPVFVPPKDILNEIGCGDSYMGAFLSQLLRYSSKEWDLEIMEEAAKFSSYVAAETLKTSEPRLGRKRLQRIFEEYSSHKSNLS